MYNKQWFEIGNNYKVIGNYCIHRYDKNDLFDNDDIVGIITKYDCNNTVAYIHDNGKIEKYPLFDNGDRFYIFGDKILQRLYNASCNDKRALQFYETCDNYEITSLQCSYILRYNNKDLLN
jgi:hypothetical protein